jgi:hypothetical protein
MIGWTGRSETAWPGIDKRQLWAADEILRISPPAFYSTVTDFARLRGWSTSVPLSTAT